MAKSIKELSIKSPKRYKIALAIAKGLNEGKKLKDIFAALGVNANTGYSVANQLKKEIAEMRYIQTEVSQNFSNLIQAKKILEENSPELAQVYHTADGFETSLLHREYPTFFRFKVSDPSQRLGPPARRGHYDLALLNPAYVRDHDAEAVSNRNIGDRGDLSTPPLLAAVEFKLFNNVWNPVRVRSVRRVLGKLRLSLQSPPHATAAYLCIFHRDVGAHPDRWDDSWPTVEKMLADAAHIRSVVAVCWPKQEREPFVHYSGPWITTGQPYM